MKAFDIRVEEYKEELRHVSHGHFLFHALLETARDQQLSAYYFLCAYHRKSSFSCSGAHGTNFPVHLLRCSRHVGAHSRQPARHQRNKLKP